MISKDTKFTDIQLDWLFRATDYEPFFSNCFGGAMIKIVGSGTRYYVLYQGSGIIIQITENEIDVLMKEHSNKNN